MIFFYLVFLFTDMAHAISVSDPEAAAMGGGNVAKPRAIYAAQINPAGLASESQLSAGAFLSYQVLQLQDLGAGESLALPRDDYKHSNAGPLTRYHFGLHIPVFSIVHFGVSGSIPSEILNLFSTSGGEREYLRYSERAQKPEIFTAAAVNLPWGTSVGVGYYHSLEAAGELQIGLSENDSRGRVQLGVEPTKAPYIGVSLNQNILGLDFSLGGQYRQESSAKADLDTQLLVDVEQFELPLNILAGMELFYEPATMDIGVGVGFGEYMVQFGYKKEYWSRFRSPNLDISSTSLARSGWTSPVLQDSETFQIGAAKQYMLGSITGRALFGGFISESAVSKDTIALSVLDSNSRGVSVGHSFAFARKDNKPSLRLDVTIGLSEIIPLKLNSSGESVTVGGEVLSFVGGISRDI